MCGIIAVVRRRGVRLTPTADEVLSPLRLALTGCDRLALGPALVGELTTVAQFLEAANTQLLGVPGVLALVNVAGLHESVEQVISDVAAAVADLDGRIDGELETAVSEEHNVALVRIRDAVWSIREDRLRTAVEVEALAGKDASLAAIEAYTSIQVALSAIDRLEVRGRDSAGVHLLVRNHGLDLGAGPHSALIAQRNADPLYRSGSVRVVEGGLSFVYKTAAEIGELGDNTAVLRSAIANDELLDLALQSEGAETIVLGHTRWASIGVISEANAHPINSEQIDGVDYPYVTAVLNGDVDNFADLKASDGLTLAPGVTTDAKVIPTMVAQRIADGLAPSDAFNQAVAQFEGSVAIAANVANTDNQLLLALRGSGQALYVGFAEDMYIVASEPYGLVEETSSYLRIDGDTPADIQNPIGSKGQVVILDGRYAGTLEGLERRSYDTSDLPVELSELVTAEITTRDIDLGDNPHFLLKEIGEAPTSFRKTLRGKVVEEAQGLRVELGQCVPDDVRADLRSGQISEITVIGQGTAHIAGSSLARALAHELAGTPVRVSSLPATELSGFGLVDDMSHVLIVAISQSGTTTDTNRTVDLARDRGARVVAIVNRRGSDLTDRSDGVLYTSDGRDVEMSVASTKAFYAQIAAGFLLACALADEVGVDPWSEDRQGLLVGLREIPDAMERVIASREAIGEAARRSGPQRRYWAMVGNGANRIAAEELRIKLSELCYKAIACDATEDKKHIDLSSEPLILVCAAGLRGSTADDVAKEVAIYSAHKAAAIVIANEDEKRFTSATDVLPVPVVHDRLAFIMSTVVGHLFGYEAALAIDAQAQPLRVARAVIEGVVVDGVVPDSVLGALKVTLQQPAHKFFDELRSGKLNGHLEASTASQLATGFRYALEMIPLDAYQLDRGKVGTPGVVLDDLDSALTAAIDELTRPIDAIKHQAKTVTVGISRADETLLQVALVGEVLLAGAPRDSLSYRSLRTIVALDVAVDAVVGYTRYRIEAGADGDDHLIVVARGGISRELRSRADDDPILRGTKHQVSRSRDVLLTRGRSDGRTIMIVPEVKDRVTIGLSLLHIRLHDRLEPAEARGVLQGYNNRLIELRDSVTETETVFRDAVLADIDVGDLLVLPIPALADRWRSGAS